MMFCLFWLLKFVDGLCPVLSASEKLNRERKKGNVREWIDCALYCLLDFEPALDGDIY